MTVHLERRGDIAVVTLDNPPVNATSRAVRQALMDVATSIAADKTIRAVVLSGAGKLFVGGADVSEFDQPPQAPHLPDVLARIEASDVPWIAALHGTALGGGAVQSQEQTHKGYEMPPYTVERVEDGHELRVYGPHLVAEVTVRGDRSTAVGRGFSVLAAVLLIVPGFLTSLAGLLLLLPLVQRGVIVLVGRHLAARGFVFDTTRATQDDIIDGEFSVMPEPRDEMLPPSKWTRH